MEVTNKGNEIDRQYPSLSRGGLKGLSQIFASDETITNAAARVVVECGEVAAQDDVSLKSKSSHKVDHESLIDVREFLKSRKVGFNDIVDIIPDCGVKKVEKVIGEIMTGIGSMFQFMRSA